MSRKKLKYVALVLVIGLGAAACGDDDDSTTTTPAATAPVTTAAGTTPSTSTAAAKDIVDTAVGAGKFTVLAEALTNADLVTTLKGAGPFTVFAPTDDAFAAALKSLNVTKDQLLADKAKLALSAPCAFGTVLFAQKRCQPLEPPPMKDKGGI